MKFDSLITRFCLLLLIIVQLACDTNENDIMDESELFWIECNENEVDATIYYISNIGSDNNSGLTENEAFNTIAKGLLMVKPSGSIRILPGVYKESIGIKSCGNSSNAIIIEGYNGVAILEGAKKSTMALYFENCDNFIVKNLRITNFTDIGIGFSSGTNLVLSALKIDNNGHAVQNKDWELEGYGIHVDFSKNIEISNCEVSQNGPNPQIVPDYIMGTGINTYGNSNVIIRNNKSFNNIGGGILVEDSYQVVVDDNEVYGNDLDATIDGWWDGGLWLDGGANVIVRNNYFHHNSGPGIEISDEDLQQPTGYILINNICTDNYYGVFIWNFGTDTWPSESIIMEEDNDFTGNSIQDVWIVDMF